MRQGLFATFLLLASGGVAFADGVAYRLPPDGTWVKYRITPGEEFTVEEFRTDDRGKRVFTKVEVPKVPKGEKREDLFLVRSVGRVDLDGKPHRWLELVNEPAEEGKEKPARTVYVLKMLIPEAAFGPGRDPLAEVRKMYLSDRRPDEAHVMEVKDAAAQKYQTERFRALFPVPPRDAKRKDAVERETTAGTFKGYELEFDYGFDGKLYAGTKGRNMHKGRYKVVVSEAAPFGIVEVVEVSSEGIEDRGDGTGLIDRSKGGRMELLEFGTGAKSALPDKK
jgi:hypothetical protein